MAMTLGGSDTEESPMSDINTTPLVDVMLVLLIIFLITIPVVVQSVPLKLPKVPNDPTQTKPENISISVQPDGTAYWGMQRLDNKDQLREKARAVLERTVANAGGRPLRPDELPEVHIRADSTTPYSAVGGVIFAVQRAGIQKIAFISEPPAGHVTR